MATGSVTWSEKKLHDVQERLRDHQSERHILSLLDGCPISYDVFDCDGGNFEKASYEDKIAFLQKHGYRKITNNAEYDNSFSFDICIGDGFDSDTLYENPFFLKGDYDLSKMYNAETNHWGGNEYYEAVSNGDFIEFSYFLNYGEGGELVTETGIYSSDSFDLLKDTRNGYYLYNDLRVLLCHPDHIYFSPIIVFDCDIVQCLMYTNSEYDDHYGTTEEVSSFIDINNDVYNTLKECAPTVISSKYSWSNIKRLSEDKSCAFDDAVSALNCSSEVGIIHVYMNNGVLFVDVIGEDGNKVIEYVDDGRHLSKGKTIQNLLNSLPVKPSLIKELYIIYNKCYVGGWKSIARKCGNELVVTMFQ